MKSQLEFLDKIQQEAVAAHELAAKQMIAHGSSWIPTLKENDLAWLDFQNLKLPYESRKISPKHEGPFHILERLGPLTYCLELPPEWNIYPVFNIALLKPYHETTEHVI